MYGGGPPHHPGRPGYPAPGYPPQGYGHAPPPQAAPPRPPAPPRKRDPEMTQRSVGKALWLTGMLTGGFLLFRFFLLAPLLYSKNPGLEYSTMLIGAVLAVPMLAVYIWIPRIVDRYDPEPWWALLLCLSWGAIAACGYSALINTSIEGWAYGQTHDKAVASAVGACLSAPVFEEATKAIAIFFMFYAFRREFDGVVDGIIYGTFAALGFAALENVIYYGNAARTEILAHKEGHLETVFLMRGILAPWGHPLYTSMTGIGFGVARETEKTWLKWLAPLAGYSVAVFMHAVWNTAATVSSGLVELMLPMWLLTVAGFGVMVVWLVRRKGKIIRKNLEDEVLMGYLTMQELDLVTSPIGWWKATFSWGGAAGRRFIDAAARLALSKWHSARATRAKKATISADFVVPLRQDLAKFRAEVSQALGRQVPQPQAWRPGMPSPLKPGR